MSKTFNLNLVLYLLLQATSVTTFAQHNPNPILDNFILVENNGRVYLNWTIVSGSTCSGIQIFRSVDSISYSQIGSIAGICGSSSSAKNYNFTDENPQINKINFYRLELGGNGTSQVLSVEIIDISAGGYQIRPNPVVGNSKIYFNNNTRLEHQLLIYNLNGTQVFSSITMKDFFELNSAAFSSGIYIFTIASQGNLPKVLGKIMIL